MQVMLDYRGPLMEANSRPIRGVIAAYSQIGVEREGDLG
jgi:hypothetical protein